MFERAALAIFVGFKVSAWAIVCFTGVGWFASFDAGPNHEKLEDRIDALTRLTIFATCLAAALIEQDVLKGDETWLAIILCSLGIGTLLLLLGS